MRTSLVCDHVLLANASGADEARSLLRNSLRGCKRVVVKAGTAVVSREGGLPSLHRIGMLVEQISLLCGSGVSVLFVTSGAVGVGRQLLRRQALLQTSIADAMSGRSQLAQELDMSKNLYSAAAAAAGQLGLSSLYATLFATHSVNVAQILVTAQDFDSDCQRNNIITTMQKMCQLGIVPIINENDAVSSNRSSTGAEAFEDNDMLAALVAREMEADLVVFVSDVDGVYDKAPSLPGSKRISVFSRGESVSISSEGRGRGGMQAKITAALTALDGSKFTRHDCRPPACALIVSGQSHSLLAALRGEDVGTLFLQQRVEARYQEVCSFVPPGVRQAEDLVAAARRGGGVLASLPGEVRSAILLTLAELLESDQEAVLAANAEDVREAVAAQISPALRDRLALDAAKLNGLARGARALASMRDPLGVAKYVPVVFSSLCALTQASRDARKISETMDLQYITTPIGLVLVVFESRPDCVAQIASLAIRSGNALLLKSGKEAMRSAAALSALVSRALSVHRVPPETISLVGSREEVERLLSCDIDLVVPRGSSALVSSIRRAARVPVLGHGAGVCHIFVDGECDEEAATRICVDAKVSYPAACNAVETVLIHQGASVRVGAMIVAALRQRNVQILFGPLAASVLGGGEPATANFETEYGDLRVNVEIVSGVDEAVRHIARFGSSHTDAIVTTNQQTAASFVATVDSACVFVNCSTRFSDGRRFGLGAEVGIATGRLPPRGPVGVDGLLSARWVLRSSDAETVSEYEGPAKTKSYSFA